MKAGELWAVVWCDRTLFSVRRLDEVMELNRRASGSSDGLLVLDLAGDLPAANVRRLELEKDRFGHAVCGRRAKETEADMLWGENDEG